jgi:DNA-binding NtrC family response regulator
LSLALYVLKRSSRGTTKKKECAEKAVHTMNTTLLICDGADGPDTLNVLKRLGHEVIVRKNATAALSVLRDAASIDLVIMDCRTNGMDFLDFLDALKKLAPNVPSIMLTENGSIETYLQACNLGVFEYMNKPVKAPEIVRIVKTALAKGQGLGLQTRAPYQEAGYKQPNRLHGESCKK